MMLSLLQAAPAPAPDGIYLPLWAISSFATLVGALLAIIGGMATVGISQFRKAISKVEQAVVDLLAAQHKISIENNEKFVSLPFFTYVRGEIKEEFEFLRDLNKETEARMVRAFEDHTRNCPKRSSDAMQFPRIKET